MSVRWSLIFMIVIVVLSGWTRADNPNLGTAGAQFLKIPVGARSVALGGAFTGLSDDAISVFWNPAGIVEVKSQAVHFSNMKWFEMFDVNAATFVFNNNRLGAFAFGAMVFSMDKMEITDEFNPNGTGRFFDAQDLSLSLTYARRLTDRFRAGVTLKYINQRIWNETANGFAFDVGTQYQLDFYNLIIAMSMRNFGPDMKMAGPDLNVKYDASNDYPNRLVPTQLETEYYPLPLSFQFGLAMDFYRSEFAKLRAAVDAVHPNDNQERIQLGSEISFYDRLFLRGGYKFNADDEQYNLGFGINAFLGGLLIYADYAYSIYDILPNVHMFSIGMNF